jgi:hypothetical protein
VGHTGFMELPSEIRNMIYEEALFGPKTGGRTMHESQIWYDKEWDHLVSFRDAYKQDSGLTAWMSILCAISKQLCWEVQGVFLVEILSRS